MCHTSNFLWRYLSGSLDCLVCSSDSLSLLREQDPPFLCFSTQEAILEIHIAHFNTWLSEIEEFQFLGAQRVPSWDLFSTEDVWESELVGKKLLWISVALVKIQWLPRIVSLFQRANKSDITSLIFQRYFPNQFCSPLDICKLLHSNWNTWAKDIPFALPESTSFSQLFNGTISVTCNENKFEFFMIPEVFPTRNILNGTNLPCST